jgi:hypothetical protein
MKPKKTKGSAWSPRYMGYRAKFDYEPFIILAGSKRVLKKIHRVIFPDLPFRPDFVHPANVRRTGD